MLCLSISQPWIELILQGRKTIEIRKWYPKDFELPIDILLHAGKTIDKKSADMYKIKVDETRTGAILGVATLVAFKPYKTREEFLADFEKHLNPANWYTGKEIGFVLENIRISQKIFPYKGALKFFEVE